jgi:hypothetical protein
MGVRGQDGLTRQQRYDQRVAAREATAEVSVGHDGDVSDRGNVRMPETSESGEASEEEPAVQSTARQEGMSDHVSDESEAREANLEAANQTQAKDKWSLHMARFCVLVRGTLGSHRCAVRVRVWMREREHCSRQRISQLCSTYEH